MFLTMQSSNHIPNIKKFFFNFKSLNLTFFRYMKDMNVSEGRSPTVLTHGITRSHHTEVPQGLPMVPPMAIAPDIWANSCGSGFRPPSVAARPPATPIMPNALPSRAVPWVERPPRAPTQHRPEPRYMIWSEERKEAIKNFSLSAQQRPLLWTDSLKCKFRQSTVDTHSSVSTSKYFSYPLGM